MTQLTRNNRIQTPGPLQCPVCHVPLRLFGVEAHPAFSRTDLETYVCPRCDGVQTQAVPAKTTHQMRRRSQTMETPATLTHENAAFDAETTHLLGATFDIAWEAVLASGNPLADAQYVTSLREMLAKRIIEMVQEGERNPHRLAENALRPLGLSQSIKIGLSS